MSRADAGACVPTPLGGQGGQTLPGLTVGRGIHRDNVTVALGERGKSFAHRAMTSPVILISTHYGLPFYRHDLSG